MPCSLPDSPAASAADLQKHSSRKRQRSPTRQIAMMEATACALPDNHDGYVVDGVPAACCLESRGRLACKEAQEHRHGLSSSSAIGKVHACHNEAGIAVGSKERQQDPWVDPAVTICSAAARPALPTEPSNADCNGVEQQSQRQVLASLPSNQLRKPPTAILGKASSELLA